MSRFLTAALLLLICSIPALASPLFDADSVLEIGLRGPLGTIGKERRDDERVEYPFVLTIDGKEIPVQVRIRGKSRTEVCQFPPLRLNFESGAADNTPFAGQHRLKLVTHCRSGQSHYENNTLDEYTAYRIFNQISEVSYRVRLLRIRYEDTDDKLRHLDQAYYGFIIESDEELAARAGGNVEHIPGVLYSKLNVDHTARLNVFQYLIANVDWSFVNHLEEDTCCHNIDLIQAEGGLYPVPFDFDLSGFVNATYAKTADRRRVTTRVYGGYCRSPIEAVALAVDEITALREQILDVTQASPAVGRDDVESRVGYIDGFFEEANDDREKLIAKFERTCLGGR